MTSKFLLRRAARARRAELARAVPDFAAHIAKAIDRLPLGPGSVVSGYRPVKDEADPSELMHAIAAKGHRLALPVVLEAGAALSFRLWSEGDPTIVNAFGIAEPAQSSETVEPTVILVPLLAFDSTGHRLGYGGGYYDRTLEKSAATAIGIAYSGQEVKELPRERHDRPLDAVVTELGFRKFG
jgi:5-formyltetrahydrofolate cyclo-ligase